MTAGSQTNPESAPLGASEGVPDRAAWADQLDRRWAGARRAALRTIVPDHTTEATEEELLEVATAADPDAVLRRVFDNSRTLGLGFRRFHRVDLTLVDVSELLPLLSAPCAQRGFQRSSTAIEARTDRSPCSAPRCAYWREALHGLVSGLASAVYYSRVESLAGGSSRCVDLLHVEFQTEARYQGISESMQAPLVAAAEKVGRISPGASVTYLGLVDGELHFILHQPGSGCGLDLNHTLRRTIEKLLPGLVVHDASPRAVLDAH